MHLRDRIDAAEGVRKADLVLRGGHSSMWHGEIYPADVALAGGCDRGGRRVRAAYRTGHDGDRRHGRYLVPGLIDGHIHIECSKLSVTMFADAVVRYGTTSVISGLDQTYRRRRAPRRPRSPSEAAASPMKIFWAAPYKVPYTVPEIERRVPPRA